MVLFLRYANIKKLYYMLLYVVMLGSHQEQTSLIARQQFRYYSRRVFEQPTSRYDHEQRIAIAKTFYEHEPVQGALADFIYAYWYDLSIEYSNLFKDIEHRLSPQVKQAFQRYLNKQDYLLNISELATRWSVLVTPSMDVAEHRLIVDRDESMRVAEKVSQQLLLARAENNLQVIEQLETDFFIHCQMCKDRRAFLTVWMKLSNQDWRFHVKWKECQALLDDMS